MRRPRAALGIAALCAILAVVPGCAARGRGGRGAPVQLAVPSLAGDLIDVAALRGRVVVLHAFTTWSLAAQADVPQLARASADGRAVVIGLALDPEGRDFAEPWRRINAVPYAVGLASPEVVAGRSGLGRIGTVPTTFILDADGRVAHRIERQLGPGELARLLSSTAPGR